MENKYIKLSDLVNSEFTVLEAYGFKWKMWSPDTKRMLMSDDYIQGYQKKYSLKTDRGSLDLGSGQLSSLLEAVYYKGEANINGKTFAVKSNGKSGMDIRYFFNLKRDAKPAPMPLKQVQDVALTAEEFDECEPVDISQIPFN